MTQAPIRRQPHGIQVQQVTVTLPGNQMAHLRKEAGRQGITVSRHVVNLLRLAWSVQGALATAPSDAEREAVAS